MMVPGDLFWWNWRDRNSDLNTVFGTKIPAKKRPIGAENGQLDPPPPPTIFHATTTTAETAVTTF